jgi:DNA transposition AAA+ family ATPase
MNAHYLGLEGAAVVATEQLLDACDLVRVVAEARGMGAIYGPAGTGKTFAVGEAVRAMGSEDHVHTDFRCRPTVRYLRSVLYECLGLGQLVVGPFDADRTLKAALSERPRLVVIDEAQWLNRECFEYLRHLHDDPGTVFSLLFVGGAGCYEVLRREPMLDSRLYAHLRFRALNESEVAAAIPLYHPIYYEVPAELVDLVDGHCAHGNFRNWAKFTHHALRFCRRTGRLRVDEDVARNVFRLLGGGFDAAI